MSQTMQTLQELLRVEGEMGFRTQATERRPLSPAKEGPVDVAYDISKMPLSWNDDATSVVTNIVTEFQHAGEALEPTKFDPARICDVPGLLRTHEVTDIEPPWDDRASAYHGVEIGYRGAYVTYRRPWHHGQRHGLETVEVYQSAACLEHTWEKDCLVRTRLLLEDGEPVWDSQEHFSPVALARLRGVFDWRWVYFVTDWPARLALIDREILEEESPISYNWALAQFTDEPFDPVVAAGKPGISNATLRVCIASMTPDEYFSSEWFTKPGLRRRTLPARAWDIREAALLAWAELHTIS